MPPRRSKLWNCPECRRKFVKRNQWHSCQVYSIDSHFHKKDPRLRKMFDSLLIRLRRFGPLRVDAVKTSINLVSKYHFSGVAVRKDHLRLSFLSDAPIHDPRIIQTLRLGPKSTAHWVILRCPAELSKDLMGWLMKAHALQSE